MPSHHRPGGGFQNPWGSGAQPRGFGAFLRWKLLDRPRPSSPSIDRDTFAASHPRVAPTFPVQVGGRNLLIDPVWSAYASPIQGVGPRRWVEPGIDLASLPPIDGVVI